MVISTCGTVRVRAAYSRQTGRAISKAISRNRNRILRTFCGKIPSMSSNSSPPRNTTPAPEHISFVIFMSFVGALGLAVAVAYYLTAGYPPVHSLLFLLDTLFAGILLLDFAIRLAYTKADRKTYFLREFGWLDLLTSLPGLPLLRIVRGVRLFQQRRALFAKTPAEVIAEGRRNLAQSTFLVVIAAGLLVLVLGTTAVLWYEARDPAANIDTGGDAIWWALVTVATVGYGDLYPVTPQGRIAGGFMIVVGVALFTVLTSYLSTIFLRQDGRLGSYSQNEEHMALLRDMSERLAALEGAQQESEDADQDEV